MNLRFHGLCFHRRTASGDAGGHLSGPVQAQAGRRALVGVAALALISGCDLLDRDGAAQGDGARDAAMTAPSAPTEPFEKGPGLPPPDAAASFEGPFAAAGSEPFWSAEIDGGEIRFSRPEEAPVVARTPGLRPAGGVLKFTAGPLQVTLAAQPCLDASGETRAYRMQIIEGGVAYQGCAQQGRFEAGPGKDWADAALELLPAIDACLAAAPGPQPRVTMAHAMAGGQASVRLIDALRGRYACSAPRAGGAVSLFEPIAQGDYVEGEGAPLLSRAPAVPAPGGQCFRTEELKDPSGGLVGWLSYDQC